MLMSSIYSCSILSPNNNKHDGSYFGTYRGDVSGSWSAIVTESTISGNAFPDFGGNIEFSGSVKKNGEFTGAGNVFAGTITWTGKIKLDGEMSGTWIQTGWFNGQGTFSGSK